MSRSLLRFGIHRQMSNLLSVVHVNPILIASASYICTLGVHLAQLQIGIKCNIVQPRTICCTKVDTEKVYINWFKRT